MSNTRGRQDTMLSPEIQLRRTDQWADANNLYWVATFEELDVSGGTPLKKRKGLRPAVEMIEAGEAQVLVAAYFHRLVRSLPVQEEILNRVREAGGQAAAPDLGNIGNATASEWLTATTHGMMNELVIRQAREAAEETHTTNVLDGVPPYAFNYPGYRKTPDKKIVVHEPEVPAVVEAFRMRAGGAAYSAIQEYLRSAGINLPLHRVQKMLASRAYLGELVFGQKLNANAWPAIVDRDIWKAAQEVKVPRGRHPQSEMLMARLGILRCATCGQAMAAGAAMGRHRRPNYRCGNKECKARVSISAKVVHDAVVKVVRRVMDDAEGPASAVARARQAAAAVETAQDELDRYLSVLTPRVQGEPVVIARIEQLTQAVDEARAEARELRLHSRTVNLTLGKDWGRLSDEGKRDLIKAIIRVPIYIAPGRPGRHDTSARILEPLAALGFD